ITPDGKFPVKPNNKKQTISRMVCFLLRTIYSCLSLWERCRAATERACISKKFSQICLIQDL
ncbi:hypothetical protein, partial [Butyricicoccus sp.]|uniref:hypothetical protein n=1 Tax=Butyricicoccus sp. TaxID=2049021 RepID=UPI003D7D5F29